MGLGLETSFIRSSALSLHSWWERSLGPREPTEPCIGRTVLMGTPVVQSNPVVYCTVSEIADRPMNRNVPADEPGTYGSSEQAPFRFRYGHSVLRSYLLPPSESQPLSVYEVCTMYFVLRTSLHKVNGACRAERRQRRQNQSCPCFFIPTSYEIHATYE